MKVLITGHLGFVGRHFWRHFMEAGDAVYACDIADERAPQDCEKGFRKNRWPDMDLVIHCAAKIPPIDKREQNDLLVAQDLATDSLMFQWALRTRPKQIVYFSSSAAYPIRLQRSEHYLAEDDLDLDAFEPPDAMYGLTKLVGELQAREARRQGLDVRVFRPFTGYGTDQSLDYPFPAFVKRAMERQAVFDIWGDGRQVRDFVHIDDIVNVVLTSLRQPDPAPLNIGTGVPITIREFAQMCADEQPGYRPAFRTHGDKPTGAVFRCADASRLAEVCQPRISLVEGIRRAMIGR